MAKGFKDLDSHPNRGSLEQLPKGWLCSWNTRKLCANKSGSKADSTPSYSYRLRRGCRFTALSAGLDRALFLQLAAWRLGSGTP